MKLLINYANNKYKSSQKLNSKSGLEVGAFDKVISYSPKDIDTDFFQQNKSILSQKEGNGVWLWKPYFIKKSLETLNNNDFLFYSDSGAYFIDSIDPLINISLEYGQDIIPFELFPHLEREWTKRDTFILMDCDTRSFTDTRQRLSGFILWKKSEFTMNFINEYLQYAKDEKIITELENQCGYPNYPDFRAHRHDQSLFSLLSKKYQLNAYRDPTQWGNGLMEEYPTSNYNQIIESTRRKGFFWVF